MVEVANTFSIKEVGLSPGVSDDGRRGVAAAWAAGGDRWEAADAGTAAVPSRTGAYPSSWAKNIFKHLWERAGEGGGTGAACWAAGGRLISPAESVLQDETGEQEAPGSEESQQLVL